MKNQREKKNSRYNKKSIDMLFERLNSKYNRIWEQQTSIFVLFVEILSGYLFTLLALNQISPFNQSLFVITTFFIITTLFMLAIGIGRLEFEKTQTKRWLRTFVDT